MIESIKCATHGSNFNTANEPRSSAPRFADPTDNEPGGEPLVGSLNWDGSVVRES